MIVFKTDSPIIAVSVSPKGQIFVYNSVQPKPLDPIDTFECDGVSDFNHAMRKVLQEHLPPTQHKMTWTWDGVERVVHGSKETLESIKEIMETANYDLAVVSNPVIS